MVANQACLLRSDLALKENAVQYPKDTNLLTLDPQSIAKDLLLIYCREMLLSGSTISSHIPIPQ